MAISNERNGHEPQRPSRDIAPKELGRADMQRLPRYAGGVKSQMNRYALSCATFFTSLLVPLLIPCTLRAQDAATAHVNVQVTDATGSGLPRVVIQLVPSPDLVPSKKETDQKGQLVLNLKPGRYTLFVNCPGFESVTSHIDVKHANDVQIVPIRLEVGGMDSPGVIRDEVKPVDELRVSAYTKHEDLKLKVADLRAMPRTTVTVHNEHSKTDETYVGVRVADVLTKMGAPLGKDLRGAALSGYLVATGSDGYVAVIALAEADPSFHSGEVIIADTMNGQPLDPNSGPFKLVVTEDKRPARWVRNLVSMELKSAK
jgi:hypothetical protein